MSEPYGYIYVITNKTNNKQYVGQSVDPVHRWRDHRREAWSTRTGCTALYNAIRKYGAESFEFDVIHECFSEEDMNVQEEHYVTVLQTQRPSGYNINPGGKARNREHLSEEIKKAYLRPDVKLKRAMHQKRRRVDMMAGKEITRVTIHEHQSRTVHHIAVRVYYVEDGKNCFVRTHFCINQDVTRDIAIHSARTYASSISSNIHDGIESSKQGVVGRQVAFGRVKDVITRIKLILMTCVMTCGERKVVQVVGYADQKAIVRTTFSVTSTLNATVNVALEFSRQFTNNVDDCTTRPPPKTKSSRSSGAAIMVPNRSVVAPNPTP